MDDAIWTVLAHQDRSLGWLARRTGVSRQYWSLLRRGRRRPSPALRARAADALGLPEGVLFAPEGVRGAEEVATA